MSGLSALFQSAPNDLIFGSQPKLLKRTSGRVRDEAEWRGAGRWKAGDGLPFVLAPA